MTITRLDIINAMLASNGVDAVTSDDSNHPDVESCLPTLKLADAEMQSRGWWFNIDWNLPLLPDMNGEIIIPANALKVDPRDQTLGYVQRGQRLYDPVKNTYAIGATVYVNLVTQLPINDLPATAQIYLKALAVHKFYVADDGDTQKASVYQTDRATAFTELKKEHIAALGMNIHLLSSVQKIQSGFRPSGRSSTNPRWPGGRIP